MTNSTQEWEASARARCDAAMKGPWENEGEDIVQDLESPEINDVVVWRESYEDDCRCCITWRDEDRDFIAHARTDLPRSLDENQRLREELIGAWPHAPYTCPCSPMQYENYTGAPAPLDECTCGLDEALYAQEGPSGK